jgi:plasmid maintenance system antidote protein VapI
MRERIQKFIDYKGVTPGDLATSLEVQRSNISHILNGRNKPGALFIEKFLNLFPEINARWLLTGKGDMIAAQRDEDDNHSKDYEEVRSEPKIIYGNDNKKESAQKDITRVILLHPDGTFTNYDPL